MTEVTIYTDGACRGNPGPGGWAAVLKSGEYYKELYGAEVQTTNNRMELTAAIKALQSLKRFDLEVKLYTDSVYVKKGITEWLKNWKAKGWKTSAKKPVKNAELWHQLDEINQKHKVKWHWLKGHAGHPGNEKADQLANQAIDELQDKESQ